MHRLTYTGASVYVADEVCAALMGYASALADAGRSDVVSIPVVDEAGIETQAEILVGPASQLFSTNVDHMAERATDTDVVADLEQRADKLRASTGGESS